MIDATTPHAAIAAAVRHDAAAFDAAAAMPMLPL